MKSRFTLIAIPALTFLAGLALGVIATRSTGERTTPVIASDTAGFRPSDASLLARTGAAQLVEFFHPE